MLRRFALLSTSAIAFVVAATAGASTITWGPATDTTGPSNISTTGTLVKAFDSGGSGVTVNGVLFAAAGGAGDDVFTALSAGTFTQFDDNADLGDANLDTLLRTGNYLAPLGSPPPTVITLSGLTSGLQYELQLFMMDQRNSPSSPPAGCAGCADRTTTLTSGANSVALEADPGNTAGSPFGQFALGTFTADASTQTFEVTGTCVFFGSECSLRQVNAWQLRAVPEPASAALLALGVSLLAWKRRIVEA